MKKDDWTFITKAFDAKGRVIVYVNGVEQTRWGRLKVWLLERLGYKRCY